MIRTDHSHNAFDDLHDFYVNHAPALRRFFDDATYTFAHVELAVGATKLVEKRLGRAVSPQSAAAIGWVVTYTSHMAEHADELRRRGASGRVFQMAWNDFVDTLKTSAISHYSGLSPHVVAQIPVVAKHIEDNHLLN